MSRISHRERCGHEWEYTPSGFCRICARARNAKHRATYPEKTRAGKAVYRAANREKCRMGLAAWRAANAEKVREDEAKYRAANPEKMRAKYHARRSRRLGATGRHTAVDVVAQLNRQRGRCYWCQRSVRQVEWHVDHVIPLSRGGSNGPENIVIACPRCNHSKGAKMPAEWAGRLL